MKHYVVILDRAHIPGELRIPDFDHVWVEHPDTAPGECGEPLWRASMGVTAEVPVSAADLARCLKLRWLVVTGPSRDIVDADVCAERGIGIVHMPSNEKDSQAFAEALMDCLEELAHR